MDFLLILLAVGGLVVAIVMLVLASRASKMRGESDARVETLQMMATGSVLFAAEGPSESVDEPLIDDEPLVDHEPLIAAEPLRTTPVAPRLQPAEPHMDLALYELLDENEPQEAEPAVVNGGLNHRRQGFGGPPEPRAKAEPADYENHEVPAFPFVMNVPAAAGAGRVLVSFDRSRRRRQP
jgi:hypothetical protein